MKPTINCNKLIGGKLVNSNNTWLIDFMNPKVVTRTMEFQMQKLMENWANVKLNKEGFIYGIRRYTRGAVLLQHVDRVPSHIISAILQIDQKVDENWPLTLIDHKGIPSHIFHLTGNMTTVSDWVNILPSPLLS